MFFVATLVIFLQCTECDTLSFTESLYHVTIHEDRIPIRISVVHLQPDRIESTSVIQYSIDDDDAEVQKSVVNIDSKSGELEFPTMLSPMSMAVTVRAITKTGSNQYETAAAVVRVHVVCFVGSHTWDAVRSLANIKFLNSANICHFEFRDTHIRLDNGSSSNLGEPQSVHLSSYRIRFLRFGCLVRSSLTCTVSEGVHLNNASIGKIGSGMKCPNVLSRPTIFSTDRNMVDVNLGDLCGTGNEDSWIDVAVVVSNTDELTHSFIDCTTSIEQTVIEDSRRRHWIKIPSEYAVLRRNRRSHSNITLTITKDNGTVQMNRPKPVTLELYFPGGKYINLASLSFMCPKSVASNKPRCTVKFVRLITGKNIKIESSTISNITDFNVVQQNRVRVNLRDIYASDKEGEPMANTISLEIEVRPTHCMELQTNNTIMVHFEGKFDDYFLPKRIPIIVRDEGRPITDFDLKMHVNTTDVYPADTVQISVTVKNKELSQCECKLLMLDLHAGPWVTDGELIDANKQNTKLNKTDLRRMEIRTDDFVSMDNWNFSINVKFAEQFDFSKYLRLRILSFTLMLYCQLQFPIDNYPWATDHTIENVILHSERNQFNQLIDQTPSETGNCQVRTWISAYHTTEAESVETTGRERIEKSPYNHRHITILLGKTSELYYIRINLTDVNEKWFSGHISITTDGRAFSDIGECTFTADHGNSYTCVFKNSFRARGLRIIPKKPVIKHKVTQFGVHLYGIAFRRDIHQFDPCIRQYTLAPEGGPTLPEQMTLFNRSYIHVAGTLIVCHPVPELATFAYPKMKCTGLVVGNVLTWFDLGPMVSQVITYQGDDKRYFALGPERNSIVNTRDLTGRWIGITLPAYQKYIDGKYHENATYIPWDETDTFNRNLSGVMCAQFQAVEWNVCYDGIYYKAKRVAVWTDETGLQFTSSN